MVEADSTSPAMAQGSFFRISSLICANILVVYAFFVMQTYLTDVWGLSFTHSAGILNIWSGMCLILPGFFLWAVDAFLGHFGMLVLSSTSYSLGIVFVFMSTPPITGTCKQFEKECIGHTQRVLFYLGMALVAVGMSGYKASLQPFFELQFDGKPATKYSAITIWQALGFLVMVIAAVTGAIALPYIRPWSIRFGIPAIFTVIGMFLFLTGFCCKYKTISHKGSPITKVFRVFVVFSTKMFKSFELNSLQYKQDQDPKKYRQPTSSRCLRGLQKAAMYREGDDDSEQRACTMAEVEEAKIAVRMIPMWMTFIICGIVSSIGNTYFVEQANNLDRRIGEWNVPLQILLLLSDGFMQFFNSFETGLLYKIKAKRANGTGENQVGTGEDRLEPHGGKRPAYGIGIAMIFSILCCITAAKIEEKRLNVIRRHGLLDRPDDDIPMSVYWLLFQFFLLAGFNSFMQKSVVAYYACEAPDSMKDYLDHFTRGVSGLGFMFNVLTVYVVGQVSETGGGRNWFQFTLNRSRLDRYYWVLASLSSGNLVAFIVVASLYRYRNVPVACEVNTDNGAFEAPREEENPYEEN